MKIQFSLAPMRLFVGSARNQYEARLWNFCLMAALLGLLGAFIFPLTGCSATKGSAGGVPAAPTSFQISGSITDALTAPTNKPLTVQLIASDGSTIVSQNVVGNPLVSTSFATYAFNGINAGTWFVIAFKDMNSNGVFDTGDSATAGITYPVISITNANVVRNYSLTQVR